MVAVVEQEYSTRPARHEKRQQWRVCLGGVTGAAGEHKIVGAIVRRHAASRTHVAFRHELARLAVHSTIAPARVCALHEEVLRALAEMREVVLIYPPSEKTARHTLNEVRRCASAGIERERIERERHERGRRAGGGRG